MLSFSGRHDEAIALLNRAIDLDPFGPAQWFNFLSRAHFFLGQNEPAIAAARTCLDRASCSLAARPLHAALAFSGKLDEAASSRQQLSEADPAMAPENMVATIAPRIPPPQADLDRLVDGLNKAAVHVAGEKKSTGPAL